MKLNLFEQPSNATSRRQFLKQFTLIVGSVGSTLTLSGPQCGTETCEETGDDVEGPYYREDAPFRSVLAPEDVPGERLFMSGTVLETDCKTPIANTLLDIWQADANGVYDLESPDYLYRGKVMTDVFGNFAFETIRPGNYPYTESGHVLRPAHIHFKMTPPGGSTLTTQLYFSDDPHLSPKDPCTGCASDDPTLIIDLTKNVDGSWEGVWTVVMRAES